MKLTLFASAALVACGPLPVTMADAGPDVLTCRGATCSEAPDGGVWDLRVWLEPDGGPKHVHGIREWTFGRPGFTGGPAGAGFATVCAGVACFTATTTASADGGALIHLDALAWDGRIVERINPAAITSPNWSVLVSPDAGVALVPDTPSQQADTRSRVANIRTFWARRTDGGSPPGW